MCPSTTLSGLIRAAPGRHVRWRDLELRTHQADFGPYRIHWAEAGEGEDAVALVHGLSGSSRWWARNIRGAGLPVPGPGAGRGGLRAQPPGGVGPAGRPRPGDVLGEWLGFAADGPPYLVGHSMGGQLAIHLAARRREHVKRLVLVDSAGLPRPLTPRM